MLYLDCGGGFITQYICQNLWKYTLKKGGFFIKFIEMTLANKIT